MLQGGPQEEIFDESRKYGQNLSTGQKFLSGDPDRYFEGVERKPTLLTFSVFQVEIPLSWTGYS